jgi:hypothetical protein
VQLPLPRVTKPSSSLSFTTASLPNGSSAGTTPRVGPVPGHDGADLSAEELTAAFHRAPAAAPVAPFLDEPTTPLLREPPNLGPPREEATPREEAPPRAEDPLKASRRVREKPRVTQRATSQIEVARPRSPGRDEPLPPISTPTTATSRKELFRSSSVHVPTPPPEVDSEEADRSAKFAGRRRLLMSGRSVHPVAEEDGEGESASERAESARPSPKKEAPLREDTKLHCLVVDDVHTNR